MDAATTGGASAAGHVETAQTFTYKAKLHWAAAPEGYPQNICRRRRPIYAA